MRRLALCTALALLLAFVRSEARGGGMLVIDSAAVDFGTVQLGDCADAKFTVSNAGIEALDVIVQISSASEFRLLSPQPPSFSLEPGESLTVFLQYCPIVAWVTDRSEIRVWEEGGGSPRAIPIQGRSIPATFELPSVIDFGDVPMGAVADTVIMVGNSEPETVELETALILHQFGDQGFSLVQAGLPPAVGGGGAFPLHLQFRPKGLDPVTDQVVVAARGRAASLVVLRGRGTAERSGHRVWLQPSLAPVAEPFALTLVCDPPLRIQERVSEIRLKLNIDPTALLPVRVLSGAIPDALDSLGYSNDGTVLARRSLASGWLYGDTLLRIEFRGYATGSRSNIVHVTELFPTDIGHAAVGSEVRVELTGSDIGRGLGVGLGASLVSASWSPQSSVIRITYRAFSGQQAQLRVIALDGAERLKMQMPPASGQTQEATVSVAGIPHGCYILELRDDGGKSIIPLIFGD